MDFVITSGRSLFEAWNDALEDRMRRFNSVRCLILNPDSQAFTVVQRTWGIVEPSEEKFRRERVLGAKTYLEDLMKVGGTAIREYLHKNFDVAGKEPMPESIRKVIDGKDDRQLLKAIKQENETRKKQGVDRLPAAEWEVRFYEKCPFYSMYVFDDKAYVAMYPFIRPGKMASPVYIYSRSSEEYERLDREFDQLWIHSTPPRDSAPAVEEPKKS